MPNLAGLERAHGRRRRPRVAIFAAASETFSRRNINQSIDESLGDLRGGLRRGARAPACACAGICRPASAARSKGPVAPARVARGRGAAARPGRLRGGDQRHDRRRASGPGAQVLDAVTARVPLDQSWRCTSTTPAARRSPTCWPASTTASTTFDSSAGGLGGCPFAPGAAGQPRHRRSALHARWPRHRDRRVARTYRRKFAIHRKL